MIPAGEGELRRAFHQHTGLAEDGTSALHYLLLFYAVECGLKSIYLRRAPIGVNTTNDIPAEDFYGHDLGRWAQELKLPISITAVNTSFHLRRDHSQWSISDAHQAWRYGVAITPADEQRLVSWLEQVHQWIEENIPS